LDRDTVASYGNIAAITRRNPLLKVEAVPLLIFHTEPKKASLTTDIAKTQDNLAVTAIDKAIL
jgi:hypothetical protein